MDKIVSNTQYVGRTHIIYNVTGMYKHYTSKFIAENGAPSLPHMFMLLNHKGIERDDNG